MDNGYALNLTVFMVCFITLRSSFADQFLLQAKVRQRYFDDGVCFLYHFFVPSSWLWCPGVTPDFDIFVSSTGNFNIGTSDHM